MSKLTGELSYKDWCILKHALIGRVNLKQSTMDIVEEAIKGRHESQYSVDRVIEQRKELAEEKATLERVTKLINNFKKYIKGNERHCHYESRPIDCE